MRDLLSTQFGKGGRYWACAFVSVLQPQPALVQMACLAEMLPIDMDALSIEQDGIPDSGRSSIFEPDH
jgi:hypothetical protein